MDPCALLRGGLAGREYHFRAERARPVGEAVVLGDEWP
jgi:hypothetical protein